MRGNRDDNMMLHRPQAQLYVRHSHKRLSSTVAGPAVHRDNALKNRCEYLGDFQTLGE